MRLRYLHIQHLPPLEDVKIEFQHESLLGRQCAIRFVVGVNGSGKTRLLRALTEIFVQLDGASKLRLPFPVALAYDIDKAKAARTVYLQYRRPNDAENYFAVLDRVLPNNYDWTEIVTEARSYNLLGQADGLPSRSEMSAYTPKSVIAYTSGNPRLWEIGFKQKDDIGLDSSAEGTESSPPNWTLAKETSRQIAEFFDDLKARFSRPDWATIKLENLREQVNQIVELTKQSDRSEETDTGLRNQRAYLVTTADLKLAALAVTLVQVVQDIDAAQTDEARQSFIEKLQEAKVPGQMMGGLRGLLNEIDWLWPIHIGLHIEFDLNTMVRQQRDRLTRLYKAATSAIKQPEPSQIRLLSFDLWRPAPIAAADASSKVSTARALAEALADPEHGFTAFEIYRTLYELRQQGILKDVEIALQKINVSGVLLYDWLSDGEQEFLGRMALFNLLHGQDDVLVILDEPETHFNDVWKRRIVDIIDDSLRDNASEVVISTHSSISLTDVFETEITLLRKDDDDGTIAVVRPAINTFGASPNEIMRHIFDAPDTVGQRATEFLDMLLMAIGQPEDVEAVWRLDDDAVEQSEPFLRLFQSLGRVPHDYGGESETRQRLLDTLRAVHRFAQQERKQSNVSVADVVNVLRDRLGPGYYEFEFNRRLRALQQRR